MITNTTAKSTYVVASGVTEYAIGFTYKTNPDGTPQIKVYKNKLSNTPLVYGVDYTISENGLNIVVDSAVEPGDRLDIIRNIPLVQISDYVIGRIDPEQIEGDFDLAVMRDQQIESDIQFVGEVPQDHENRIQGLESDVTNIESVIPNQATDSNQLADKEFVNSSIATSTATFRGTYNSLAELEAVTADDNDYGFVVSTDQAGNTVYSRYKYVSEQTSGLVFTPNTITNNTLLQFVSGTMTYLADSNSWRLQAISDLGYTVDQTEPQSFWEDPMRGFVFSGTYEDGDVVSFVRETITTGSWVFEYNLNNSSFTADQWDAINSGITADIVESLGATTGKTVGEIFFTMRNDNGLRGAVECNGATYNTTDFTGATSIGNLLVLNKVPYVSLANYATLLEQNGAVGVFGWDGQGTTAFRVPSLNDIFIETGTAAQIGDYIAPGIPNITANFGVKGGENLSGAAYNAGSYPQNALSSGSGSGTNIGFNASRSSSVYKNNVTTVQPNTVRYRAMVQLAVGATDEALETCTGVLADVAGLKDASNLTSIGKLNIIDMVMPDYANSVNITLNTSTTYTAQQSGYIAFNGTSNGTVGLAVNNIPVSQASWSGGKTIGVWCMVATGDVVSVVSTSGQSVTVNSAKFIPCKGA